MARRAVVLFNLGGPDSPDSVEPFLFNLFNDAAIIALPGPLRWVIAKLISRRRAPIAREIYAKIGGGSPLLANTEAQARALEAALGPDHRCFVAMRYWRPTIDEAASSVAAWRPDEVLLLPLYPQFSTTTTGSSLRAWHRAARRAGLKAPTRALCCYPREEGFIAALAAQIVPLLDKLDPALGRPRVLFSAHGLPKKIVTAGDPYQWQVERTVAAIVEKLARPGLDWVTCYQSRVGPLQWIGPGTDAEIARAGRDKVPVVVAPVAFVSEHSETLVELDIDYRHLAEREGVPAYLRAPTVGTASSFIDGLAASVRALETGGDAVRAQEGMRICPIGFGKCVCA
jgi:ferrochelatase